MADYTHILVAVDFSSSAVQVLKKALEICQRNKAKLSLLHIVEYLPPIDSAYEPVLSSNWVIDETELLDQSRKSLEKFSQEHIQESDMEVTSLFTFLGTPKYEISEFVKKNQCDLIVLGSHGRHGIGLLLGSTANAVLHDMPCDILAVKIDK